MESAQARAVRLLLGCDLPWQVAADFTRSILLRQTPHHLWILIYLPPNLESSPECCQDPLPRYMADQGRKVHLLHHGPEG